MQEREALDATSRPALDPALAGGTLLGKRYYAADSGLEVLCTKGGQGSLSSNGEPLTVQAPKKLPSSD